MAPNIVNGTLMPVIINEASQSPIVSIPPIKQSNPKVIKSQPIEEKEEKKPSFIFRKDIKWANVVMITILHILGIYGFVVYFPYVQNLRLFLWTFMLGMMAAFGVTGGVHRYWTHKAYKAKTPLKIILAICYLTAGQNSIVQWVKDHRVHHKYSETDADPHNSNRGFFFAHVGWLMLKKHPDVIRKGRQLDVSDIYNEPVAAFFERHFMLYKVLVCFVIPILVPVFCWNEDWVITILFQLSRYMYVLNATWCVNSFAHFFGNKPYDRHISPVESNFVAYVSLGEGWHNYHHVFPSDYRAAEIGGGRFNLTTKLIDFFARIGWAYDLKEPSDSLVKMTIANRGDGSHEHAAEIARKATIEPTNFDNTKNGFSDTHTKTS
ncbi:acyl-CoA Delta(11) desaturase-like [Phymastichus coffea]|uniref:acyl-CoA Delta(11) desaturase-like n=1 Tax=Phymastichus coffea TaxID=108790 RepID=UPI00273A763A|nr:acyl-CoA Delta(11) desaturase-like [Phymastichus coffea]